MYGRYSVRIQITQTTYFIVGHVTQLFIYAKLYLLASLMKDIQRAILAFPDVKFNHVCLLQKCRLKRCNGIARDISACHATMCHEDDMIFSLLAKIKPYACVSSSAEHFSMHPCRGYDNIRNIDRQGRRDVVSPTFQAVPAGISRKVFPCA